MRRLIFFLVFSMGLVLFGQRMDQHHNLVKVDLIGLSFVKVWAFKSGEYQFSVDFERCISKFPRFSFSSDFSASTFEERLWIQNGPEPSRASSRQFDLELGFGPRYYLYTFGSNVLFSIFFEGQIRSVFAQATIFPDQTDGIPQLDIMKLVLGWRFSGGMQVGLGKRFTAELRSGIASRRLIASGDLVYAIPLELNLGFRF